MLECMSKKSKVQSTPFIAYYLLLKYSSQMFLHPIYPAVHISSQLAKLLIMAGILFPAPFPRSFRVANY